MHDILIYPEAIKIMEENGLAKRLSDKKNELPFISSHYSARDVVSAVNWLKEETYYDFMDKDFRKIYTKTMNDMFSNPNKYFWTIDAYTHLSKTPSREMETSDMQLFTGDIASILLKPEEMWDYKKFGFNSETGFVSTLSAYIIEKSRNNYDDERNYSWTTSRADSSKIKTSIERYVHGDFRLFQRDINSYKTFDPFGNEVLFRPKFNEEWGAIYGYHSVEPSIFVTLLKYADQEKLESEMLANKAEKLLEYASSMGDSRGNFGEAFGNPRDQSMHHFVPYNIDIPKLHNNIPEHYSPYSMYIEGGGHYGAYIDGRDLVFSRTQIKNPRTPDEIIHVSAKFVPQDIDHLLKGIVFQCATGMGRTHIGEITNLIKYKYSGQYEKDYQDYMNRQ